MDDFETIEILDSGHVRIASRTDGVKWRRSLDPHSVDDLDLYAPWLSVEQRQAVLDKWAIIPVPPPRADPPSPLPEDTDIVAEDLLRALLSSGTLNQGQIIAAKRDRGKPIP